MWCFLEKLWILTSWPKWRKRWKSVTSVWWWVHHLCTALYVLPTPTPDPFSLPPHPHPRPFLPPASRGPAAAALSHSDLHNGGLDVVNDVTAPPGVERRLVHPPSFTQQPCLGPRLQPGGSQWQNSTQQWRQNLSTSRKSCHTCRVTVCDTVLFYWMDIYLFIIFYKLNVFVHYCPYIFRSAALQLFVFVFPSIYRVWRLFMWP